MTFPTTRLRRLRATETMRRMVSETVVGPHQLICPMFVVDGHNVRQPVAAMPGCDRLSVDALVEDARRLADQGVSGVMLFGVPEEKDAEGSGAHRADGPVARGIESIKAILPDLAVWADVCLCGYTDHGHCGVLRNGRIDNDATLPLLAAAALTCAQAGADVVAPSDMMDGRVAAIRQALDGAGFVDTAVVSYAAKYASAFYGPFREAAHSAPSFGDRRGYQMNPANAREALREVAQDIDEGADMVIVKPALAYLDIIRRVRDRFDVPVVAYNVSGEYSMVMAAAQNGWIDGDRVAREILLSIRRAGADVIVSYFAKDAARILKGD